MSDKFLKLAGIVGIGYLLFNALSSAVSSRFSFGATRIRLGNLSPTGVQVTVTQPVSNTNPISFPLDTMNFQILYGENLLTTLTLPAPVTVEANGTTNLEFDSFLDFSNLTGSVAAIIASGQFLQALRVKGYAVSSGIIIPFEHTVTIG